nr:MAG TPA: hypothetical protein [Caudoviricetes sp.]
MRVIAVQIQPPLWICSRLDCNQDHRSRQTGKDQKSLADHFFRFMFLLIHVEEIKKTWVC